MTNGEKIKEIFPSTDSRLDEKTGIMLVKWVDGATKCFKAEWWNAEYKEPTTKNNLAVDKLISDCEKMSFDIDFFNKPLKVVALDAVKNIVNDLPSITSQEPTTSSNIPFIMHKEMDIPISECQKAYDVAMEYLRSQAKVKG